MEVTFVGDDYNRALALLKSDDLMVEMPVEGYVQFLTACFYEGREKDQESVIREAMRTYNKPAPEAMLAWATQVRERGAYPLSVVDE